MAKSKEALKRAVGYCRTSGEGQRDNTSIPRQKSAIEAACKVNNWEFVRHYVDECKSGSKIEGRDDFQEMRRDATDGKFDVLVPFDATRLARDGVDVVSTAKVLKDSFDILTVDAKGQFDSRDHRNALRNFVQAGVSEHERLTIMDRMIGGKVARAKDNIPANGRLPYGRTFDREKNEWGVDKEKQEQLRNIADRYIAGESLRSLSDEFPKSYSQLWKILNHGCGDTWTVTYNASEIAINETITHQVPRLLPESTIRSVKRRMKANTRHRRGTSKNEYLLGGKVFCANCGTTMSGAVRPNGTRMYRHNFRKAMDCSCSPKPNVIAKDLESAVVSDLAKLLGNPAAIERAVKAAVPESENLKKKIEKANAELAKIEKARDRVLDLIEDDAITAEQSKKKLKALKDTEAGLRESLNQLQETMSHVPDEEAIRYFVEQGEDWIMVFDDKGNTYAGGNDVASYLAMWDGPNTGPDLKRLVQSAFEMSSVDGSPAGVYVTYVGGPTHGPKRFNYELRGQLVGHRKGATTFRSIGQKRSVLR